jgi:hypothetical protein
MKNFINLLSETLLLEKKIAQIKSNITLEFNFDIVKTNHIDGRRTRDNIEGYNDIPITNDEIIYFIELFKNDISRAIVSEDIIDEDIFVIRSVSKELSCAIKAQLETGTFWRLIVVTIFRESSINKLNTWEGQFIIEK